jgi:pimeloyl-ACP methyl ester carboxylesterase
VIRAIGRALHSETLKLKRSFALVMLLIAPVLLALLATFAQWAAVSSGTGDLVATFWQSLSHNGFTIWSLFLLPLLVALEAALLGGLDHSESQWKHLFALPLSRYWLFAAKFLMLQAMILLSTLIACALIAASGWLLLLFYPSLAAAGPPPVWSIVVPALQCWLAAGLIISLNLWIALRWPSFVVPLAAGVGGTFFALFASSAEAAKYYPWLLPFNVISAPERLHVSLFLGIAGGIVVGIAACIDLEQREEAAPARLGRRATAAWLAIVGGFVAIGIYSDRALLFAPRQSYHTKMVQVEKGVDLEVLDWGGTGRPVVLLAGLGDTAHVYESFATKLTPKYHVYAITRRGFGASSVPASGYTADRLGDDVVAVMTALKINRPVLVGHSVGGEELSSVGARYPEKVAGLIYLDAAYSYAYYDPALGDFDIDLFGLESKLKQIEPGSGVRDPRPVISEILTSLPGFDRVLQEQLKELEAQRTPGGANPAAAAGERATRPGLAPARSILAGERKFARITVPILAIYALPHLTKPGNASFEALDRNSITGPRANAFEEHFPSARVVRLPNASHYIFKSNEADVLREMNAFISALPIR